MECLQIAQVLADLSDLQNTVRAAPHPHLPTYLYLYPHSPLPPDLALFLCQSPGIVLDLSLLSNRIYNSSALKTNQLSSSKDPAAATSLLAANHNRPSLNRRTQTSPVGEPVKFDRLGRRIVGPMRPTPPLSRANSTMTSSTTSIGLGSNTSSGAGTPNANERGNPLDVSLFSLYTCLKG